MSPSSGIAMAESVERQLGDPFAPPADTYHQDVIVRSVDVREARWDIEHKEVGGDRGGFSILTDELPWAKRSVEPPAEGDRMRIYMHNGWTTVGFDLRGERLFLRSEREMNLRWLSFRARRRREEAR